MTEQTTPPPRLRGPGALRSETQLVIQTRHAQRLVYGRRSDDGRPAIIGLLRYATMLRPIWAGAAGDDPWADWWLVQIERELIDARESMEALTQSVRQRLTGAPSIDVQLAQSVEPARIPLSFTSPYAFMGAYLLADFDALVRAVLTGRHIALLDRDTAERTLREGGRYVRRVYNTAHGYRYLAVTRDDLRLQTAKGAKALEMLGPVPQEVIDGTLRAAHAPEIRAPGTRNRPPSAAEGGAQRADVDDMDDDDWLDREDSDEDAGAAGGADVATAGRARG